MWITRLAILLIPDNFWPWSMCPVDIVVPHRLIICMPILSFRFMLFLCCCIICVFPIAKLLSMVLPSVKLLRDLRASSRKTTTSFWIFAHLSPNFYNLPHLCSSSHQMSTSCRIDLMHCRVLIVPQGPSLQLDLHIFGLSRGQVHKEQRNACSAALRSLLHALSTENSAYPALVLRLLWALKPPLGICDHCSILVVV